MQFLEKLKGNDQPTSVKTTSSELNIPNKSALDSSDKSTVLWKDHPQVSHFYKLLAMGIPVDAVKVRMKQNGLDGSLLEYLRYFHLIA